MRCFICSTLVLHFHTLKILQPLRLLQDMIYPRVCHVCQRWLVTGEQGLCLHCFQELPKTGFGFQKGNPVENLFRARIPVAYASAFIYFQETGISKKLLHDIKYLGGRELASTLGRLFAQELLLHNTNFKPDGIIPVPLHPRKKRQRGYNQSEAIASGMAEIFGCAMRTDMVIRKKYTQSQTRRNRIDRWENVEQVFGMNPKARVHSGSYMLVDDVITTGATLESCAQTLVNAQVGEIGIAGLALAKG